LCIDKISEILFPKLLEVAQTSVDAYKKRELPFPDPSFAIRLPNDVYSGSNLFAIQKTFDGKFQFDIFFESGSNKQKLDGLCLFV
jgi:mannosyl-oligosaccharide glucosidase